MKLILKLIALLSLTQCVTPGSEELSPRELATKVATAAYGWGSPLVENGRVPDLNEIGLLYHARADWADKELQIKLTKVHQRLANYKPENGVERDAIMFIFDGLLPMSRGMSKVTVPHASEKDGKWNILIQGVITKGVQWNVKSKKVSLQFVVTNEQGKFCVKDVLIDEEGFKRSLSKWLDEVTQM